MIDGRTFLVKKQLNFPVSCDRMRERSLKDCYTRPSAKKQSIYEDWKKWANENNIERFGIHSYNTNVFTLEGIYYNKENDTNYYIYITPSYHYAYEIL